MEPRHDILREYRRRTLSLMAIACSVLAAPLAIVNFVDGYPELALPILCMVIVLAVNAYAFRFRRVVVITMGFFLVSLLVVIYISLLRRGIYGSFWAFPCVLLIAFALPKWIFQIYAGILVVAASVMMLWLIDFNVAIRASLSLLAVVIFTNIFLHVLEKLQERLITDSTHDPLTGALNRRELDALLGETIERKRRSNAPASLLLFDIDDFKSLNDDFGHAVGDDVLRKFVTLIVTHSRKLDKLFRTGGEEFVLLLPDTTIEGAKVLAEKLLIDVAEANFVPGRHITTSIGLIDLQPLQTVDEWIKRGDTALYSAKQGGRNRIAVGKL